MSCSVARIKVISSYLLPLNTVLSFGKIKVSKGAQSGRNEKHFDLATNSH